MTHKRIGITIPQEMLEEIDRIRRISNRSKFIVELIREPLKKLRRVWGTTAKKESISCWF